MIWHQTGSCEDFMKGLTALFFVRFQIDNFLTPQITFILAHQDLNHVANRTPSMYLKYSYFIPQSDDWFTLKGWGGIIRNLFNHVPSFSYFFIDKHIRYCMSSQLYPDPSTHCGSWKVVPETITQSQWDSNSRSLSYMPSAFIYFNS